MLLQVPTNLIICVDYVLLQFPTPSDTECPLSFGSQRLSCLIIGNGSKIELCLVINWNQF